MPHGMCYLWQPEVLWLHVISDALIALAYLAIPAALIYFVRRRRDIPFDGMIWCFGVFITACGATHAMEVWNVWHANYLLAGGIKALTAVASVPTAILLVRLIPKALALPSPRQLQKSEERFRMAAKAGKMFAYEWDVASDEMERSGEWADILDLDEAAGVTGRDVLAKIHPDDHDSFLNAIGALSSRNPKLEISYRVVRADGAVLWVQRNSWAEFDEGGNLVRMVGMVADVTERKQIEQKLRNLSYQLLHAQDVERRNVARDLHESAGQSLAALKMTLGNVEYSLDNSGEWREELKAARGFAEDAIREVRVISYLMHPPLLDDVGLGPALEWYARGFSQRSGVEVKLDLDRNLGRQPQDIETTIFRIVQEALTNVYRHSGSAVARICLRLENQCIRVEVADQGHGLAGASGGEQRSMMLGVGIAGMRERVKQLHGAFALESEAGRGMIVRAILPIPGAAALAS
jgi:PAS domain S-box-containing protein